MDAARFREAVLAQLEATDGWVDRDEVAWLRANPAEHLTAVEIDTAFDFSALLERLSK